MISSITLSRPVTVGVLKDEQADGGVEDSATVRQLRYRIRLLIERK